MRVFLDDNACPDLAGASLGETIAAAAALVEAERRLIVEIEVDGEVLTGDALERLDASAAAPGEVRLTSADPTELVCQALGDASTALEDADQLQRSAAELLQSDDGVAAMERLNDAISIWQSVRQAVVMGARLAGVNLHRMCTQAKGGAGAIDDLALCLKGLQAALESKDTVAISDALLYDLPHIVERWRGLLSELEAQVRSAGQER